MAQIDFPLATLRAPGVEVVISKRVIDPVTVPYEDDDGRSRIRHDGMIVGLEAHCVEASQPVTVIMSRDTRPNPKRIEFRLRENQRQFAADFDSAVGVGFSLVT
jgi:hypothetical protein